MLLFQLMLLVHFPSFGLNYISQYTVCTSIQSLLHFPLVMVKPCQNVRKYILYFLSSSFFSLIYTKYLISAATLKYPSLLSHSYRSFGCHPFLLFSFESDLHLHRSHLCVSKWIFNAHTCLNESLHLVRPFRAQVGSKRTKWLLEKFRERAVARHRSGQAQKNKKVNFIYSFSEPLKDVWVWEGLFYNWKFGGEKLWVGK